MRRATAVAMVFTGGAMVWGCGTHDDAKPATTAAPVVTAPVTATAKPTAAPAATAEASKPPPLPAGRSPRPTLDEWRALKQEVTVKGSSALKCETKIIREYLRVSCKGDVTPEGSPRGIKLIKGGREAMVFAHEGVMSLIVPYVEGTDFEAGFSWSKKSHKLSVQWPKGSKTQPVIVGVFEGAASPLDGTAEGDFAKLCECYKKHYHQPTCDNVFGAPDADCDRTYGDDCGALIKCAAGDMSVVPRCLPGFVNFAPNGRCVKQCGPGRDACPSGLVCTGAYGLYGGKPICATE